MNINKKIFAVIILATLTGGVLITLWSFGQFNTSPSKIITDDIVELDKIDSISKFRSCQGHEYGSDQMGETPSSMKHYFNPKFEYGFTNDSIKIYACFTGKLSRLTDWEPFTGGGEGRGRQFQISGPKGYYAVYMHISILDNITNGMKVNSGDWLGYADCRSDSIDYSSNFDICIHSGLIPQKSFSYFEMITDDVFAKYQARGIETRATMIITEEERAADPCDCGTPDPNHPEECRFTNSDPSEVVYLN